MRAFLLPGAVLLLAGCSGIGTVTSEPPPVNPAYTWSVTSPDHEQTFSYGMEQDRVWVQRGNHLAVLMKFSNDPFVDRDHPREVDNFSFAFPGITLGADGKTFFYHAPDGRRVPVAVKQPDFFGVTEVHLVPNAELLVAKPHGYLTLTIVIGK